MGLLSVLWSNWLFLTVTFFCIAGTVACIPFYSRCNGSEIFVTLAKNVVLTIDGARADLMATCTVKFTAAHHHTKLRYKFNDGHLTSGDVRLTTYEGLNNIFWKTHVWSKYAMPEGGDFRLADEQLKFTVDRLTGLDFHLRIEITAQDQSEHAVDLPDGAIVGIVFGCLLLVCLSAVLAGLLIKFCQQKRLSRIEPSTAIATVYKQDNAILRNTFAAVNTDERDLSRLKTGSHLRSLSRMGSNPPIGLVARFLANNSTSSAREVPIPRRTRPEETGVIPQRVERPVRQLSFFQRPASQPNEAWARPASQPNTTSYPPLGRQRSVHVEPQAWEDIVKQPSFVRDDTPLPSPGNGDRFRRTSVHSDQTKPERVPWRSQRQSVSPQFAGGQLGSKSDMSQRVIAQRNESLQSPQLVRKQPPRALASPERDLYAVELSTLRSTASKRDDQVNSPKHSILVEQSSAPMEASRKRGSPVNEPSSVKLQSLPLKHHDDEPRTTASREIWRKRGHDKNKLIPRKSFDGGQDVVDDWSLRRLKSVEIKPSESPSIPFRKKFSTKNNPWK